MSARMRDRCRMSQPRLPIWQTWRMHDTRLARRRRAPAPRAASAARHHARRSLAGVGDLGEHAVAAGVRRSQADLGAAAAARAQPRRHARRPRRCAAARRPTRAPATGDEQRHHHGSVDGTSGRDPGLQGRARPGRRERTARPRLQTHEGYEWLYVLDGRLRFRLGEHDLVLAAGEAAEFDTRVPHWFGPADDEVVEFLSLFGKQGERAHLRAGPRRRPPAGSAS